MAERDIERLGINVIRGISMDAPQRAGSGHPGTAMALAPLGHVLFTRVMRYDPTNPTWPDRDRFVLSCGHACILQYALLYLCGFGLELDDLRRFRQLGSRTPGHPEVHHHTPGIEVTTGPLGQGFANGVGMGIAERWLRARFSPEVADHHTFVICSDGDLMEGVSAEAASLAGHLGLGRLVYVYDDNHITIDGPTELAFSDDTAARFGAYGWHVDDLGEAANDLDTLESSLRRAMAVDDKPSLIILRSHIGYGSSSVDTKEAHGSPLGPDVIREAKRAFGLPPDEEFWVPDDVLAMYREMVPRGEALRREWQTRFDAWDGNKTAWEAAQRLGGIDGWETKLPTFEVGEKIATRKAVNEVLNATMDVVPGLVSGGADLTGNTGTQLDSPLQSAAQPDGRLVAYGVREHAMGAAMNGMAAHGGLLAVGGTFFNFSDYMRGSIRLAALSEYKVIYSFTHDSAGLGEDGPTHQPVEQLASLRAMPQLRVIRPADANETAHAFRLAVDGTGPTALVLTRQGVPVLEGTASAFEGVARGAYVLVEDTEADVTLVGTGSEVHLCLDAVPLLHAEGVSARVVSMPCWDLFEEASPDEQEEVLPSDVPVLAVEAASPFGWDRWADGVVGLDHFGASGPGGEVLEAFGFTARNVSDQAVALLDALDEGDIDADAEEPAVGRVRS